MDWFAWLSRTGLDPLFTYEYGLLFARNGLKPHQIPTFSHQFLHKIGISDAKHRLEILNLAKHQPAQTKPLLSALAKTKICLRNCLRRLIPTKPKPGHPAEIPPVLVEKLGRVANSSPNRASKNVSHSGPLDGRAHEKLMMMNNNSKSLKLSGPLKERPMFPRSPRRASGPVEGRVSDWASSKSPKLNGPPKMMKLIPPCRSPRVSGPLDGSPRICCRCNKERIETDDDYHSLWVSLFYDIKPT